MKCLANHKNFMNVMTLMQVLLLGLSTFLLLGRFEGYPFKMFLGIAVLHCVMSWSTPFGKEIIMSISAQQLQVAMF